MRIYDTICVVYNYLYIKYVGLYVVYKTRKTKLRIK